MAVKRKRVILDHLGNEYSSYDQMCNAYNVDVALYKKRVRRGWEKSKALGCGLNVRDHLGHKFESEIEMCKYYGITVTILHARINNGWSLGEALTSNFLNHAKDVEVGIYDHLGNYFETKSDLCRAYNISVKKLTARLNRGWTLERALTYDGVYDHLGNRFNTKKELCEAYGISMGAYIYRRKHRWSLEDTLTKPVIGGNMIQGVDRVDSNSVLNSDLTSGSDTAQSRVYDKKSFEKDVVYDHLGNEYNTTWGMCNAYKVKPVDYYRRLQAGWSLEKALTFKGKS